MKAYKISVSNEKELASELRRVGSSRASLPFFEAKREIVPIFVDKLPCAAANILKQELLSAGGDAAVHEHSVDCGAERSAAVLFGTKRQLRKAARKLKAMPWWGLPEIGEEIEKIISAKKSLSVETARGKLSFDRTLIMGILNLTEDSFFAASRTEVKNAAAKAGQMEEDGADIIDLGAESTRPGAERVPEEAEAAKISRAVEAIRKQTDIPISVDTTRASVAEAALKAGADIINDVSGLTYDAGMAKVCSDYGAAYILMHIRGTPQTMDSMCRYDDILLEINDFFEKQIRYAESEGLDRSRIILDPGLGFAKNAKQNRSLLKNLDAFRRFDLPILIGASRKRFLNEGARPEERLCETLAVTSACAQKGIEILRVHDVKENRKIINFFKAVDEADE